MVEDQHIAQWLAEGLITRPQAERMSADVAVHRKQRSSDKLIVAMSTVGAILLGIGAMLFVASNWQELTRHAKVMLLTGSTFAVSYLGYVLTYARRNYPNVGTALLFLGSLLFGATIFLIGQMYHVQAHSHALLLIWLAGILPLVYVLQSVPITGLACLLLYLWIGFFVFRGMNASDVDWVLMPILYLVSGLTVFQVGRLHYLSERLGKVARMYRLASLKVVLLSLFLLTFRFFSGVYEHWSPRLHDAAAPAMATGITLIAIAAILLTVANRLLNPVQPDIIKLEAVISLTLASIALLFVFFPPTTNIYAVVFNLAMAGCIGAVITVGYQREDIQLVNIGMQATVLLIIVRYCDLFWEMLSRSMFFLVGGAILVLGGIAMERKRRELKAKFSQ